MTHAEWLEGLRLKIEKKSDMAQGSAGSSDTAKGKKPPSFPRVTDPGRPLKGMLRYLEAEFGKGNRLFDSLKKTTTTATVLERSVPSKHVFQISSLLKPTRGTGNEDSRRMRVAVARRASHHPKELQHSRIAPASQNTVRQLANVGRLRLGNVRSLA